MHSSNFVTTRMHKNAMTNFNHTKSKIVLFIWIGMQVGDKKQEHILIILEATDILHTPEVIDIREDIHQDLILVQYPDLHLAHQADPQDEEDTLVLLEDGILDHQESILDLLDEIQEVQDVPDHHDEIPELQDGSLNLLEGNLGLHESPL